MSSAIVAQKTTLVTGGEVSKTPVPLVTIVSPNPTRPRWHTSNHTAANPLRRLAAAVVLQAVYDACYPTTHVGHQDRAEAVEFLHSPDGDSLLRRFIGVPQ